MITTLYSVKGGSGTTVTAAALAIQAAEKGEDVLLVDLGGDLPAALGLPTVDLPGVTDVNVHLSAYRSFIKHARTIVNHPPRSGGVLEVLRYGAGDLESPLAVGLLIQALHELPEGQHVIIDAGTLRPEVMPAISPATITSLLVIRGCYLALRRFNDAKPQVRPSGVIVINETGRSLSANDIRDVVRAPIVAEIDYDPNVSRAVDAGLLPSRLPRYIARALEGAA